MTYSKEYQYEPLKSPRSIRVLAISPGSSPTVVGQLIEYPLTKASYEAISYVWGGDNRTHSLSMVDGSEISITTSLYHALTSIRHGDAISGPRVVWADAVCINQQDDGEKQQQIMMMADIYRKARRVITYVGPDTKNVSIGIELAKRLLKCHRAPPRHRKNISWQGRECKDHRIPHRQDPSFESLTDFLSRKWYTRMWIVQESVLCKNMVIMCGNFCVQWKLLEDIRDTITMGPYGPFFDACPRSESQNGSLTMIYEMRARFRKHQSLNTRPPLLELLVQSRDLDCGNPLDRVFALSSIVRERIVPDYQKTPTQLFTDTGRELISAHGTMVLSYAGASQQLPDLPSWCPDWSSRPSEIPMFQCRRFNAGLPWTYSAKSKMDDSMNDWQVDDRTLKLEGMVLGTISHVSDTLRRTFITSRMDRFEWARNQHRRLVKLSNGIDRYPDTLNPQQRYSEAIWRTLINNVNLKESIRFLDPTGSAPSYLSNSFADYVNPDLTRAKNEAYSYLLDMTGPEWSRPPPLDDQVIMAYLRDYHLGFGTGDKDRVDNPFHSKKIGRGEGYKYRDAVLKSGNLYRVLITTEHGHIGMACYGVQPGDVVAVIRGAMVSFVLRPVHGGKRQFRLICDCYLHGFMNGEAFQVEGHGNQWEELVIV